MSKASVSDFYYDQAKGMNSSTRSYEDRTNNGECSKCGECCNTFLPLTEQDVSTIKEYVKANNIQPCYHGTGAELDAYCPFLDSNKRCKIYEVRPLICRFFKCSRKHLPPRQQKAFINKNMRYANLWAEIFNDYRLDFLFSKLKEVFNNAAINRKKF